MRKYKKIAFLSLLAFAIFSIIQSGWLDHLSLESIKSNLSAWQSSAQNNLLTTTLIFFTAYVIVTAFSFPGATVLTLLAGALFGDMIGLLIVSFASTMGATLAFLGTRFFLQNWVEQKFPEALSRINQGLKKDGAFYLLSLRLVPAVPFFIVNLAMGLTQMSTLRFYIISQIGMIPGTLAYVHAGRELGKIETLSGLLSPQVLGAFVLLGIFPWLAKIALVAWKNHRLYRDFQKPKSFDFNVIVIGGGSAGLVTSYIAAAVKAKVALVEKHKMGGDCLNFGCVPSKALIRSAKVAYLASKAKEYGIDVGPVLPNFRQIMERVQTVITQIEPHDSATRYSGLGVTCIEGGAKIISPFEIQVGNKILTTKNIVIASGAEPFVPQIPGVENSNFLTSDTLWNLRELPKHFLVVGGGPIGCELAQAFARLGSKVTLVEKGPRLMARGDLEASAEILYQFQSEGIQVRLNSEIQSFQPGCAFIQSKNGLEQISYDQVLIALGRKARTQGFGLEKLGIELNPSGTIEHDEFLRTRFPNIYVCGDCAGPYQFTHVAAHQAWYAAVNALFSPIKKFKQDNRVIPSVTFTDPEVSQVGLTESEAAEKGLGFEITKYGLDDLDRAICDGENRGFVKILTAKGSDQILGATIVGSHSGEFLTEIVLAMKYRLGLNKILATIHSYPTWAESNKNAAGVWKATHAPQFLLKMLNHFHHWRRS